MYSTQVASKVWVTFHTNSSVRNLSSETDNVKTGKRKDQGLLKHGLHAVSASAVGPDCVAACAALHSRAGAPACRALS